jgi:hypothetical protein
MLPHLKSWTRFACFATGFAYGADDGNPTRTASGPRSRVHSVAGPGCPNAAAVKRHQTADRSPSTRSSAFLGGATHRPHVRQLDRHLARIRNVATTTEAPVRPDWGRPEKGCASWTNRTCQFCGNVPRAVTNMRLISSSSWLASRATSTNCGALPTRATPRQAMCWGSWKSDDRSRSSRLAAR